MKQITNDQFETLREVLYWRNEEQIHRNLLSKSIKELRNSLDKCQSEKIPQDVVNLVLMDENGSGVIEILKENNIEIGEFN